MEYPADTKQHLYSIVSRESCFWQLDGVHCIRMLHSVQLLAAHVYGLLFSAGLHGGFTENCCMLHLETALMRAWSAA